MNWQGKKDTFKDGEKRIIKRFALFPVKLDDYRWIWLEPYCIEQVFFVPWLHGVYHWHFWPTFINTRKFQ